MEKIYRYILEQTSAGIIDKKSASEMIKMLKKSSDGKKDIAIIGIAVNLPMAESLDSYWDILSNSVNCIRDLPENRKKDLDSYLQYTNPFGEDTNYVKGGYLENINNFDYSFFKLTPKEASLMEPCQRIFLQTAFESIEDAGYGGDKLKGSNTGVYVGFANTLKDCYQKMIFDVEKSSVSESIASNLGAIIPSRLSYFLDLNGPSMVVDTACSSSLVAVHLACKAILNGECEQAVAGGIKLHTVPVDAEFSKMGIESSDGYTRAFDDTADGAGIGEGSISIFLKTIDKAIEDRDHIYAVIKGSAINQDGSSMGITAPNPIAQTKVILKAWKDAGVDPKNIQYIETHGTGTILGDPIEIDGINKAFSQYTNRKQFCSIGSVKSNIGHTYECSGLASLVKVILSLKNETMLPSLHFEKPNRNVDFSNSAVYVNSKLRPWKSDEGKRLCGVNSFGFSGTNCHVVLGEAPKLEKLEVIDNINVITFSAENENSLYNIVKKYNEFLETKEDKDIHDICFTANTTRGQYSNRIAIVFKNIQELKEKIYLIVSKKNSNNKGIYCGHHKIVTSNYVDVENDRISEEMRIKLSLSADEILKSISLEKVGIENDINSLCDLFVKGATIKWENLYSNNTTIVSIPTYQFDLQRCWLDIPEINKLEEESDLGYFNINWIKENKKEKLENIVEDNHVIFIIKNSGNIFADELAALLEKENNNVIKVEVSNKYKAINERSYLINDSQDDYEMLFENAQEYKKIKIIYMYDSNSDEFNEEYKRILNFYYLIKALSLLTHNSIHIDVVLKNINEVSFPEVCYPANASIQGMMSSIPIEYPELQCRTIDIDKNTKSEVILKEILGNQDDKLVAYRKEERYRPIFEPLTLQEKAEEIVSFKNNGVYVISGGLGEISLEIMKHISKKENVNFALLCHSNFPERNKWEDIIKDDSNENRINKNRIEAILNIQQNGSNVELYKCDISDSDEVEKNISKIRNAFSKINGVIHAAGVPGNKLLMAENIYSFEAVLEPKIKGAWNLDLSTKEDDLEFFIMFSSIATLIPAPCQCSYVAANSYLDAFVSFRNNYRKNTHVINWSTWRDVGMAKRCNMNVDTIFKALPTNMGIDGFENVIKYNIPKVLIGNINYNKRYAKSWKNLNFILNDNIQNKLKKLVDSNDNNINKEIIQNTNECKKLELIGRTDGIYSETEISIGNILAKLLGFSKLYVYDNLFELGIDSIIMVKVVNEIINIWGVEIELTRFIQGASIEKLASEIDELVVNKKSIEIEVENLESTENNDEYFDLTEVQSAYLMGRKEIFDIGNISTHAYLEIESDMHVDRLNDALCKVILKHDMLRAVIDDNGKQRVLSSVPKYKIIYEDLINDSDYMERIISERNRMSHRIFDTSVWPLFEFKAYKLSETKNLLALDFDMLIADAASLQLIINDIVEFYDNADLEVPTFEYSFKNYVNNYSKIRSTELYAKDKKYWLDKLAEFPTAPSLPMIAKPEDIVNPHFNRLECTLTKEQWKELKNNAKQHGVTASSLICAAYCEVLSYWSNQKRFVLNLATFNRYPFHRDVEKLVGDFTSVVLLDVDMGEKNDLVSESINIQNKILEGLDHRRYEGVEFIREYVKDRQLGTKAAMPIVFTSMIYGEDNETFNLLGEKTYGISQTSQVYIDCQVTNTSGGLSVIWDYVEDLFDKKLIAEMFNNFTRILLEIANKEQVKPPILSLCDKEIIKNYNQTEENIPETTLTKLFKEQVILASNKIAIKFENNSISYEELDKKSNQVARYLLSKKIEKGEFVGVEASRCIETIVNILGILKAGAVYVPIDPSYPDERKNYIIVNSAVNHYLEHTSYESFDIATYSSEMLEEINSPDDVAYVIYTSGSTGNPKGVIITHKEVTNTIIDINQKLNVSFDDNIIGISSMCFDLSVYDIFGSLSSGATLVMVSDQRDIKNLIDTVIKENITLWNSVPSIMELCVDAMKSGQEDNNLRAVLLSGDWIPLNLFDKIKKQFSKSEVISLGGATEASIWSIYYPIKKVENEWTSIPYGIPLANQNMYVLNYKQELCPIGVEGELYIGGKGVAEGYLNNKEITDNAFINHSLLGRIYKTGDYGIMHKVSDKSVIEFRGRKDYQVKIRGYRVELGEIEKCILMNDEIKNAIVLDCIDKNGIKSLCAYLVAEETFNLEELQKQLKKQLPSYMVPTYYVSLDNIPLTANGKIDRNRLPAPKVKEESEEKYIAPRNEIESKVVDIFKNVLSLDKIGVKDDFYEIGIPSISMIQLVDKVGEEFNNIELKFKDVLEQNDISELAELIKTKLNECDINEEIENIQLENTPEKKKVFYWSPVKQWKLIDNNIKIGEKVYSNFDLNTFIKSYSLFQDGIEKEDLLNNEQVDKEKAEVIVNELIKDRVLINSVLSYQEIFNDMKMPFDNEYGDEIIIDATKNAEFKKVQLSRQINIGINNPIFLNSEFDYPKEITQRRSLRTFDEDRKISLLDFSKMIATFKQEKSENGVTYFYPSAGGVYPIDIYVYVKEGRVENLNGGIYYYNPQNSSLQLINYKSDITDKAYYYSNKGIFKSSAMSVFMIYNASANMPKYKSLGYVYAALDAGTMISTFTIIAESLGSAVCSIGDMKFAEIQDDFRLSNDQVWLHTIEVGLKPNSNLK